MCVCVCVCVCACVRLRACRIREDMYRCMDACKHAVSIHSYIRTLIRVLIHIYTVANGVSNPFDVVKSRVQVTRNACMSLCTHACHACVHAVKSRVQVAHTPMRQCALETLTPLLRHVRHGYFIEPS